MEPPTEVAESSTMSATSSSDMGGKGSTTEDEGSGTKELTDPTAPTESGTTSSDNKPDKNNGAIMYDVFSIFYALFSTLLTMLINYRRTIIK